MRFSSMIFFTDIEALLEPRRTKVEEEKNYFELGARNLHINHIGFFFLITDLRYVYIFFILQIRKIRHKEENIMHSVLPIIGKFRTRIQEYLIADAFPAALCPEVCKGLDNISYVLRKEKQGAFFWFVLFKESGAFYGGICRRGRCEVERFRYQKDRGEKMFAWSYCMA